MGTCKACKIDFKKKPPKPYKYPSNIPISKDMFDSVEKLRGDKNGRVNIRRNRPKR